MGGVVGCGILQFFGAQGTFIANFSKCHAIILQYIDQ